VEYVIMLCYRNLLLSLSVKEFGKVRGKRMVDLFSPNTMYKPHACYNAVATGQSTVGVHRVDYVA